MRGAAAVAGLALLTATGLGVSPAAAATTGPASGNGMSHNPAMSADGRFVAFTSNATNLVGGDTNDQDDVFLRDTQSGTTTRISVSSTGEQGNDGSFDPDVSADGRYVAFVSSAANLVAGDTNNKQDTFVHDTQSGTTTRVNVSTEGRQDSQGSAGASISGNGRFVAFHSVGSYLVAGDTNYLRDVFVRDTQLGTTTRVSVGGAATEANEASALPRISGDGRFVAFTSDASNLVTGDTNGQSDIFLRDTQLKTTTRVNVSSAGGQANDQVIGLGSYERPAISADGRLVAFTSFAGNLVTGDANGQTDAFVRDTKLKTTTRVSVSSSGGQGNSHTANPVFSSTGRFVAFVSGSSTLVAGDTNNVNDVFLRDTQLNTTTRVNVGAGGQQAADNSDYAAVSTDGRFIAFDSLAPGLVAEDTNNQSDVFVRDRQGTTQLVSGSAS